jgi:hypothetical protein
VEIHQPQLIKAAALMVGKALEVATQELQILVVGAAAAALVRPAVLAVQAS